MTLVALAALALSAGALADPAGESQGAFTDPQSPAARAISELFWLTTWIAIVTAVVVYGLMAYMLMKFKVKPTDAPEPAEIVKGAGEEDDHPTHHNKLEAAYTAATAVVFAGLVILSATTLFAIETPEQGDAMMVQVTGHQWFWEFHYPAENVTESAKLSEMHVPINKVVRLEIRSTDVMHAVWIPNLGVKIDAVPGHVNGFWFKAEKEGRYLLECAEFCGLAHSVMHGVVVVESQAAFEAWVASKRAFIPPPPPVLITGGTLNITIEDAHIFTELPLDIEQGANITVVVRNAGSQPHGFAMGAPYEAVNTSWLNSSESANVTAVFNTPVANGTWFSPLGLDRDLGLSGTFNVTATARVIDVYMLQVAGSHGSWSISPETIEVAAGEVIRFRVHNNGTADHNLKLGDPYPINTPMIREGESLLTPQITVSESTAYWCDVPGHRELGMEGGLHVTGSVAAPPTEPASTVPGFDAALAAPALAVAAVAGAIVRRRRR